MQNLSQERQTSTPGMTQLSDWMSLLEMGNITFPCLKEADRLFDLQLWKTGF